ncbi:unnamed protein product [Pneumocystis jirovecii]|uniref:Uncharacterized protein n=1 Tax=Pneumocystis jirovecii TaxID=42068 RepID=L0PAB5_PNEJI|nr:unnamed protein product [Pneumocystis jirovecii]
MERNKFGTINITFSAYSKFSLFLDEISKYKLPLSTMNISACNGCNYDNVPVIFLLKVKGNNDDLRKMLLWSKQRNLSICIYKVLPFAKNIGILEWVFHTLPI